MMTLKTVARGRIYVREGVEGAKPEIYFGKWLPDFLTYGNSKWKLKGVGSKLNGRTAEVLAAKPRRNE